jgi:hypothetical protein
MALRGRIGAHVLHSRYDSRELTRPAREAFLAQFERQVDPDGVLPAAERERRAQHARQAYMARLARASARARSRGKAVGADPLTPETEVQHASV